MIIPLGIAPYAQHHPPLPPHLISLGSDEVLIVELQGALTAEGDTSGQFVGTLVIDSRTNKPALKIGHHLLEGTIQNLPKPYAVLSRSNHLEFRAPESLEPSRERRSDGGGEEATAGVQVQIGSEQDNNILPRKNASYDIVTIVKKKIVFARRPIPIVPTNMKS